MDKREGFLSRNSLDGGFLQSEHWADFQKELGKKYYLVGEGDYQALVIQNNLPIVGGYLYVPRGPIFGEDETKNQQLVEGIQKLAKDQKAGWIRIEVQGESDLNVFKQKLFKSKHDHQPAETLMIDLGQTENELLAEMKQKTRYNIRLATKKGVDIRISKEEKDLDIFWDLVQETAQRDGVNFHEKSYYQKMIKSISGDNLELLLASKEGEVVGAVLISFYGGVATYLHGASSNQHRNLMANYLLQWEAIKRAKKKGCKRYDFFGIAVNKNKEKWAGITRFKRGFSTKGLPTIFPGCRDIVISPVKYLIYRIIQIVKH